MKKIFLAASLFAFFLQSCAQVHTRQDPLSTDKRNELYNTIAQEIKATHASHLKECNCMKAFYRDLFATPNQTARYVFDSKVLEHAPHKKSVSVLAIGAGLLLNELTAFAHILARGQDLNIYLTDWSYVFYGDPDFETRALDLGEHPEKIPPGWKNFYFWEWAKSKKEPYLPFFENYHRAIDEFKAIIARLDKIYHTTSVVTVIKPASDKPVLLPPLDMIIAIDAYQDLPALMRNLMYPLRLGSSKIRFVALNKTAPLGGFWDVADMTQREAISKMPVTVEIYDVSGDDLAGSYQFVERSTFEPNDEQIKKAPNFTTNPDRDTTMSPLDDEKAK